MADGEACSQELLPLISRALPSVISYSLPSERVVQANAEGARILARHSSTLSEKFDGDDSAAGDEGDGVASGGESRLLVSAKGDAPMSGDGDVIVETELFLKKVTASSYAHKSWTDMRRTLVYLRTEVRFYNEVVPLLLSEKNSKGDSNSDGNNNTEKAALHKHIPMVYHADYDLGGLVSEDSPATDAKQPSPFPEDDDGAQKERALEGRGGHILLQSLSPSHGYFQDSPISTQQSLSCLAALAELHASAWGNVPLLKKVSDRLSDAGGSYQLRFRNPKELQNMVASWESFRGHFSGVGDGITSILEKESVVRLGQRVYDMADYVSTELLPSVEDEYATLVHGDFKAMNVFLPAELQDGNEAAIMIDFSCTGIGYGMSDVGMHIVHAVLPEHLENGGEERLVEGYLLALEDAVNRVNRNGKAKWTYPRDIAMRHYRLACIDYLRFIMGRFWRSATPENFEKKKSSKNTTLINRNLNAAMAFIEKVDKYLEIFEREKRDRQEA
ncbi:hypothetical protein ACHAWF_004075 [Thalassiosira exigua]